jgi:hypothetical protein
MKIGIIESKKILQPIAVSGLTHEYLFEEPSPNVIDTVGSTNGTPYGGVTFEESGMEGNAVLFNGTDGRIIFPDNLEINSFPFSVSFYLKKTTAGDRITPLNQRESSKYVGFDIDIRSNAIYCGYGNGLGKEVTDRRTFVNTSAGINDVNWNKISVEFIDKDTVKLYKNSQLFSMTFHSGGNFEPNFDSNVKLMVDQSAPYYSSGFIDSLKIYNRTLTSQEQ